MKRPALEVADIIRAHGAQFRQHHPTSREQRRALAAIEHCRTATLGAHREQCDQCGEEVIAYNSCRNRHCPKCQGSAQTAWVSKQQADLLPAPYFHLVFTLPDELAPLALQNQRVIYDLLFGAAWDTLRTIAADPRHLGAQVGMIAVLHTWGQSLTHHPHLHCVVPGGGLSPDGACWIASRKKFFLPVKVLSRLFRRLFLTALQNAFEQAQLAFHGQLAELNQPLRFSSLLAQLWRKEWVVYAKRPFGGPAQVRTSGPTPDCGECATAIKEIGSDARWSLPNHSPLHRALRRGLLKVCPTRLRPPPAACSVRSLSGSPGDTKPKLQAHSIAIDDPRFRSTSSIVPPRRKGVRY